MTFEQRGGLLKVGQPPRRVGGVLVGLAGECRRPRRLQHQAPMQVDAAESSGLFKKRKPVIDEYLRDRIRVTLFARQVAAGTDARVLIEARSLGQSTQSAFNRTHLGFKL